MKKLLADTDLLKLQFQKSLLESGGISAFIRNENAAMLRYLLPLQETTPELWIANDEDLEKALSLLSAPPAAGKTPRPRIFIGTKNKHKISEISAILRGCGAEAIVPDDLGGLPDVEEDGHSFEENASKKAIAFAKFAAATFPEQGGGAMAIADDSGLEVEALFGAPGVHSSRYAEDDLRRIAKLLTEIGRANKRSGEDNRRARFVCVIALASPDGVEECFRGEVSGSIIETPRGSNGFGYDPVFVPDAFSLTFAELPSAEKNKISHRSRALAKLDQYMRTKHE